MTAPKFVRHAVNAAGVVTASSVAFGLGFLEAHAELRSTELHLKAHKMEVVASQARRAVEELGKMRPGAVRAELRALPRTLRRVLTPSNAGLLGFTIKWARDAQDRHQWTELVDRLAGAFTPVPEREDPKETTLH